MMMALRVFGIFTIKFIDMFKKILLFIFYIILFFAVFVRFEFKLKFWYIFISILFFSLILNILNKKNTISFLILMLCFSIVSFFCFGTFLVDYFLQPEIPALNCDGDLPMNGNWIRGLAVGLLISLSFVSIYYKVFLKEKFYEERVLSIILLLLLLISIIFEDLTFDIYTFIQQFSKPLVVYPEDC